MTQKWPADRPERRKVADLTPYARNARTHSDAQVAQIAASIKEWGWTNPILIDGTGGIIAGHGRVLAARKLGIEEVPVLVADGWTEAQKRAYVIADNKLALNAGWDEALLKVEFGELAGLDFDLSLTGFSLDEIGRITGAAGGLTDEDDIPAPPKIPVVKKGDLWILGDHRLVCGDSTVAGDVELALGGVKPMLMVTDPPYGVEYDASWRTKAKGPDGRVLSSGKDGAMGKVENDDRYDWREAWALFPGDAAYVWHGGLHSAEVAESLQACGFVIRSQIIWNKSGLLIGRGDYHWKHEPCWYAVRKGGTGHWAGDRKQSTVWDIDKQRKNETGHSTQKPVECMRRPMVNNSSTGQAVYDPFLGSGTSIIAAETIGRACIGLELQPAYCDVIIERWQNFTGQKAVRGNKNGAPKSAAVVESADA